MFADRAKIIIKSGKGGDGHVSFRREKFVPAGGPDGGDGGKGGDVVFEIDNGMNNLSDYRHRRKFAATAGEEGGKKKCHGKNGTDLVLKVPEGTVVKDAASGKVIADMSRDNRRQVVLKGGRGGLGNMHFATSTMQAPKYAQPGGPSIELEVQLELKVLADVGLVGFPNVGKSTLLSRLTNANPEIANYHFTTLNPILGVVDLEDGKGFVMADIPGLIEGASEGVGLGHEFLRHIERTKVLLHLVDGASVEGRDPVEDIKTINEELSAYNMDLMSKPQIIVANKMDAVSPEEKEAILAKLHEAFPDNKIFVISAVSGEGIDPLIREVAAELEAYQGEDIIYEQEFDPSDLLAEEGSYTVEVNEDGEYVVEGPKIEKMLGYTNIDSEKGFIFFQRFLKEQGILKELEEKGIQEGDTVRMYGLVFDYYK
ncbi:MAG: GTPase ObgE [Lachnospiraceae bacterium]|nr:GTPase ObgE [Lachnospiraceae bacterium]MBQ1639723.1 GTPase ObgE [Lachnospiraceae bacterium]MBQ2317290.1 GTPase ObgE [Lachnospiraceae bacterium]MBQ2466554.1 GTPase ObgE [Lachnospiraceae bacterium]MBQ2503945.1 GTPase ObgE [Lachnospiraceae bacterium]